MHLFKTIFLDQDPKETKKEMEKNENANGDIEPKKDTSESSLETVFDMVVERDGHFDLVTPEDMTASAEYRKGQQSSKDEKTQLFGNKSRPSSAISAKSTASTFRVPKVRPISCPIYHSPYGLTPEQKELARKKMVLQEQAKKEEEEAKKMKEKEKQMLNEEAFQCWLKRIRENEQAARKKEEYMRELQQKEKEDKVSGKLLKKNEFLFSSNGSLINFNIMSTHVELFHA